MCVSFYFVNALPVLALLINDICVFAGWSATMVVGLDESDQGQKTFVFL